MTSTLKIVSVAASLLVVTASSAEAQIARKYVTPDGKIIYSDVPVPGAREVGEVTAPQKLDPQGRDLQRRGSAGGNAPRDAERAKEAEERANENRVQEERIRNAEAQFEVARDTLANAKEPLPGERIGTAGGNSRLTDAYFKRQEANQRAVAQAQEQLDAARAGR